MVVPCKPLDASKQQIRVTKLVLRKGVEEISVTDLACLAHYKTKVYGRVMCLE